jgi:hypothetical protein
MTALSGMKEICNHVSRSEATVLVLIRDEGFPATKLGGIWESDTELISEWRKNRIATATKKPAAVKKGAIRVSR